MPAVPAMTSLSRRPDPASEIRVTGLHAVRGANYWSRRPVTRLDLTVGAYDELSSAEVPGVRERLAAALPGLVEHRCSLGVRGGFLERLRRGTYVPHIVEHVALELQGMIGHDVGFGRTRGGDVPGEYTLVFEHVHEGVGLRAAALALDAVEQAFAGTLESVDAAVAELRAIAATAEGPPLGLAVRGAVTGGALRAETRRALERALGADDVPIVDLAPAFLLYAGLPFRSARFAVVLDARLPGVPARYQERDRAERLLGVVADGVERDGVFVAPAGAGELQDYARRRRCRVAVLGADRPPADRELEGAWWAAWAERGRLRVTRGGAADDTAGERDEALRDDLPVPAQLAAALVRQGLAAQDVHYEAVPGAA